MIAPIRSGTTYRNSRPSSGTTSARHEQLPELDADVEGEERCEHVGAGELQFLAQREREAEAVNEPESKRHDPAPAHACRVHVTRR